MNLEEFLRDVSPNHTEKSKWNKVEILHILKLYREELRLEGSILTNTEDCDSSNFLKCMYWRSQKKGCKGCNNPYTPIP